VGCRNRPSFPGTDRPMSGSMYITHEDWIVYFGHQPHPWKTPTVLARAKYAARERSLALGTNSGHVFVLRIPPALLTSPETRVVDGKVRERYVNAMLHLADDLSEDDRIGQVDQKY
jgi:hypothetical protein